MGEKKIKGWEVPNILLWINNTSFCFAALQFLIHFFGVGSSTGPFGWGAFSYVLSQRRFHSCPGSDTPSRPCISPVSPPFLGISCSLLLLSRCASCFSLPLLRSPSCPGILSCISCFFCQGNTALKQIFQKHHRLCLGWSIAEPGVSGMDNNPWPTHREVPLPKLLSNRQREQELSSVCSFSLASPQHYWRHPWALHGN